MWVNVDIVMLNGGRGNDFEFNLHEAGCFFNVGVIKERWITTAMRVPRELQNNLAQCIIFFEVTHIECYNMEVKSSVTSKMVNKYVPLTKKVTVHQELGMSFK